MLALLQFLDHVTVIILLIINLLLKCMPVAFFFFEQSGCLFFKQFLLSAQIL
jgi:hypothetical protein